MATNFKPKGDVQVIIGSGSANLGVAHATSDTWNAVHVTDYNIEQASAPIEVAPPRSGLYGHVESMGHHRPDTQTYEASLTMRGTPTAVLKSCLSLFGDGASAAELTPGSNTGTMKDNTANTSAVTLLFENAGSDASNIDVIMPGCFCSSMTLSEDIGSNGGELVVNANFWSAYQPTEGTLTPDSKTLDTASPKNIFSLSTQTLDGNALILNGWSLTISRSLSRIRNQNTTDYKPFGYVQSSPYEVSGTLTAKRDDSISALASKIKGDSAGIALSIAESSGFTLSCPDVMIDNSKPEVGEFLMQTIPFKGFAASETANIVSLTIS